MFRVFHYLDAVYKEQSFSRAAQKLYLAQPSLSLTIKKFEKSIGIQIFDRSTSPIQLTEAGKVYMEGVHRILSIQNDLDAYLDDYKELKTGSLVLGAPHMFSSYLLPTLIARFLNEYPGINIRLVEGDFLSLHDMTLAGEIDLLIESNEFDEALFQSYPLLTEHLLLAVPNRDPVNKTLIDNLLTINDVCTDRHMATECTAPSLYLFHKHNFLMLEKGHDMFSRVMRLCKNSGFEPNVLMVLNQLMTVYNLCDQQLGVSFITDTIVKLSNKGHNLCFYKLDGEQTVRHINLTHKRNRYISRPMKAFIRMMLDISLGGISSIAATSSI